MFGPFRKMFTIHDRFDTVGPFRYLVNGFPAPVRRLGYSPFGRPGTSKYFRTNKMPYGHHVNLGSLSCCLLLYGQASAWMKVSTDASTTNNWYYTTKGLKMPLIFLTIPLPTGYFYSRWFAFAVLLHSFTGSLTVSFDLLSSISS